MADDDQENASRPLQPQWVLLFVSVLLSLIGLSFCFAPVQPPSACLERGVVIAGSAPEHIGVCPP